MYTFGPYPVVGRTITCEVCGHKYIGSSCVMCEKAAENGDWVDHVIKEKEKNESGDT